MKNKYKEDKSRCEARKLMRRLHPDILRTELVHHIDFNPLNNDLGNLVVMDKWEHQELHCKLNKKIKTKKALPTAIARLIFKAGFTEEEARKFLKNMTNNS